MVNFSLRLPASDYLGFEATPDAIVDTAVVAEELGFDAVVVNDHIIVDGSPRAAVWANSYDPFVVLAYVAARTTRVRVGTSVLILPYRNPLATAKAFATLDRMSGGRAVAGVGAGWNAAEFAALGIPFSERGARATECLRLWQACWGPDPVDFAGKFTSFSGMLVRPKPIQQPGIETWIGGASAGALRRAARFAHTWQPMQTPVDQLIEQQEQLRAACEAIGRVVPPATRMSLTVNVAGDWDAAKAASTLAAALDQYQQEGGVAAFQVNFHGCRDGAHLLESARWFAADVMPSAV